MAKRKQQLANDIEVDSGADSLEDAKISGYTDAKGRAVSRGIRDETESSVGGYTNITSGRSSVVRHQHHTSKNQK